MTLYFNKKINRELLDKTNRSCITDDILNEKYKIIKRIGTPSINGEVFLSCFPLNDCKYDIVVKKIPIQQIFMKNLLKNNLNKENIQNSVFFTELYFLELCKILSYKIPNLPFYYNYTICDQKNKCRFNKKITNQYSDKITSKTYIKGCGYLLVEKAEGDLKTFLNTKSYTIKDLLVIYFQIFIGLYLLKINTDMNFIHGDLHWGNVLYKKNNDKNGKYVYDLLDKKVCIPNIGYTFFIWDFGSSRIKKILENPSYDHVFKNSDVTDDFYHIVGSLPSDKDQVSEHMRKKQKIAKKILELVLDNNDSIKDCIINLSDFIMSDNKEYKTLKTFKVSKVDNLPSLHNIIKKINKG